MPKTLSTNCSDPKPQVQFSTIQSQLQNNVHQKESIITYYNSNIIKETKMHFIHLQFSILHPSLLLKTSSCALLYRLSSTGFLQGSVWIHLPPDEETRRRCVTHQCNSAPCPQYKPKQYWNIHQNPRPHIYIDLLERLDVVNKIWLVKAISSHCHSF